jgi:hypothetical protein
MWVSNLGSHCKGEHRLMVFEKVMRIFTPKSGKLIAGWRKQYNKKFYSAPNVIRIIKSRMV